MNAQNRPSRCRKWRRSDCSAVKKASLLWRLVHTISTRRLINRVFGRQVLARPARSGCAAIASATERSSAVQNRIR